MARARGSHAEAARRTAVTREGELSMPAAVWVVTVLVLGAAAAATVWRLLGSPGMTPRRPRATAPANDRESLLNILDEEMRPSVYDEYLDALAAADAASSGEAGAEAIRVRRWGERRAKPTDIRANQVLALHRAFPRFIRVAYEIEDPWRAYTLESAGYMENAAWGRMGAFMEHVWQGDERRHAAVFRAAYLGITGLEDVQPNPHVVAPVSPGAQAFEQHMFMRLMAELSAAATYSVFAAHAKADLAACMRNVAGDEYRHLAIFWAGIKWRYGEWATTRVAKLCYQGALLGLDHRHRRTGLNRMDAQDAVFVTEIGTAMALAVGRLLVWDQKLTGPRLERVFGRQPTRQEALAPFKTASVPPALSM